jgi:hypothetical protein
VEYEIGMSEYRKYIKSIKNVQQDRKEARENEHRIKSEHINSNYSHAALVSIIKGKNEKFKNKV